MNPSPEVPRTTESPPPEWLEGKAAHNLLGLFFAEPDLPTQLGRYRILKEIGRGGFGKVLLAEDELLKRPVAIKVLGRHAQDPESGNATLLAETAFLSEARMVAKMNHPGIVPIYDITETEEGEYCIVSRYVEGRTLREHLLTRRFTFAETVRITVAVSEALHHAHQLGVVHRDVKPANIMLTGNDQPMLLDFGLARCWDEIAGEGYAAGTPGYMSPEQARGEDHLVNARSDIFSLGVVFYEMLTARQAFAVRSLNEHLDLISAGGPQSLRRAFADVPKELDRICMKAMAVQIRARYPVATDMAEDLRTWLTSAADTVVGGPAAVPRVTNTKDISSSRSSIGPVSSDHDPTAPRVVPRGLRAFDGGDSEFFLSLVPGPRDRHGLPESLRFWKQRIESTDENLAFRVGVLYGPSGCGKSSLVRAGLLPRCAPHVTMLYHEARDSGNAACLGRSLRLKFPQLDAEDPSPAALLHQLRKGGQLEEGAKLLVVIDQSEQWLRASEVTGSDEGIALLNTLRQCDGTRVQVLMLVRDDFWRGISRVLADADVELDNNNSALVDLFEPRHAEGVLEKFGRAYGCLPSTIGTDLSKGAREFIRQSVQSLEEDRRISPVRLALFADMFRTRDWTVEALKSVGGVGGVAVTFLEESFRGPAARGPQRIHEKAARQVLPLLVPETGDVRGPACLQSAMLEASGYSGRSNAFKELLHVLDADLRLLTPVDSAETSDGQPSWQLTHDHMVPALRDWLLARKADTLRGRAEISLGERAREWHLRPDHARLPGLFEWLRLRLLTKRQRWVPVETQWMNAGRKRAQAWGLGLTAAGLLVGWMMHDLRGTEHGRDLAARVLQAPPDEVHGLLAEGRNWMAWARPDLEEATKLSIESPAGFNARLALVATTPAFLAPLANSTLDAEAPTFGAIREALSTYRSVPIEAFQTVLTDSTTTNGRKLRAVAALATFRPKDPSLADVGSSATLWLLTSVNEVSAWASHLRPLASELSPSLEAALNDSSGADKSIASNAALALASLHSRDAKALTSLLPKFPPPSVPLLVSALREHATAKALLAMLEPPSAVRRGRTQSEVLSEEDEAEYVGWSNVLIANASLGMDKGFWTALSRKADRTLRTFLLINAAAVGLPAETLARRLLVEKDAGVRQALLLALTSYPPSALPASLQEHVAVWLRKTYRTDPDGGVHSSVATLMQRWSLLDGLTQLQKSLSKLPLPAPGMGWWITPSGMDMRVITRPDGTQFAISAREVTETEYKRFERIKHYGSVTEGRNLPVSSRTWINAAHYALWLSEKENLAKEEMCYEVHDDNVSPHPKATSRSGFRMPTTQEWLMAANSAPSTFWDFGNALSCLPNYGWVAVNAGDNPRPVGTLLPNEQGLWDTIGNVSELTHELITTRNTSTCHVLGRDCLSPKSTLLDSIPLQVGLTAIGLQTGIRLARGLPPMKTN